MLSVKMPNSRFFAVKMFKNNHWQLWWDFFLPHSKHLLLSPTVTSFSGVQATYCASQMTPPPHQPPAAYANCLFSFSSSSWETTCSQKKKKKWDTYFSASSISCLNKNITAGHLSLQNILIFNETVLSEKNAQQLT